MLAAAWQWAAESPLSGEGIALPGSWPERPDLMGPAGAKSFV